MAKWGSGKRARGKPIRVVYNGKEVICELRDTMGHRRAIKNGAGIDLNPGAQKAFGVKPPFLLKNVKWAWVDK